MSYFPRVPGVYLPVKGGRHSKGAEASADTNADVRDAAAVASSHSPASAAAQMSVFHPHQFVDPKRSAAAVCGR